MPNAIQLQVGGTVYDIIDKDAQESLLSFLNMVNNFPAGKVYIDLSELSGTVTSNTAWSILGNPVAGVQYNYKTITLTGSEGFISVTGASWGDEWPLVSFYDANNELISTSEVTGDTRYTQKSIAVPYNARKVIVNGSLSPYEAAAFKYSGETQNILNRDVVKPFTDDISKSYITNHPSFASFRNYEANRIYNIGADAYTEISDIPNGFNSNGSLVKLIGYKNPIENNKGYSNYLLVTASGMWCGFDTSVSIVWTNLSGTASSNRKILFIGDSYAQGYSHDGSNQGWPKYAAGFMGLTTADYVVSANGGASFSNSGNSFLSLLNAATVKDYTDIVLAGGFNDYLYTKNEIDTAISAFVARANALYPNARLHIGCIGWIKQGTGESAISEWQTVRTAITGTVIPAYQGAIRFGALYMVNSEYLLGENGLTPTDGYHPSEDGNKAIAQGIANAIISGSAPIQYRQTLRAD